MFYWSLIFFIFSLVAAIFGFGGIASTSAEIAKVLFFIGLVFFIVFTFLGFMRRKP